MLHQFCLKTGTLRGEGGGVWQKAEVKWAGQRFIGIILKTADKGKLLRFKLNVFKVSFVFSSSSCSTYVALSFGGL